MNLRQPIFSWVCPVVSTALAVVALLSSGPAAAQSDPKFDFAKADAKADAARPQWRAQLKAGGLLSTGNSQASSVALGVTLSRKEGSNKLSLDGGLAYGTTNVLTPIVDNTNPATPMLTGFDRQSLTTTNNWFTKGRYDRFLTTNNSAYASAQAAGDKIAGKTFYGGGQVGYSRQLVKNERNTLVAELGYDYSYERYVQQPSIAPPPVSVHSARVFAGETLTLTQTSGITASAEALFNVNKESKALNHVNGLPGVDPFKDTRLIGRAALTTTVWKALSVAFGFTVKYDQNPAPLPIPGSAPPKAATAFAATAGVPFAEAWDTLTELTLIYTFL